MGTKVRIFLALFAFWLIISEGMQWNNLLVGALCSAAIIILNRDLLWEKSDLPRFTLRRTWLMIQLVGILLVEVVKANIDVVKIVLSPTIECRQGVIVFCPTVKHTWLRVMLANCITLTPGTMTLDIEDDCFTVHLLDMRSADSVISWKIADKLSSLEDE